MSDNDQTRELARLQKILDKWTIRHPEAVKGVARMRRYLDWAAADMESANPGQAAHWLLGAREEWGFIISTESAAAMRRVEKMPGGRRKNALAAHTLAIIDIWKKSFGSHTHVYAKLEEDPRFEKINDGEVRFKATGVIIRKKSFRQTLSRALNRPARKR
jgi:hypothetical protein